MSFLSNLFGGLTGSSQRKALRNANAQAQGYLDTGEGDLRAGYNKAFGYIDPYAQMGLQAQTSYFDALGLNGEQARARFQQMYQSDPMLSGAAALDQNRLMKLYNAQGSANSGVAALAGARAGMENYGNFLNRFAGQGQQGQQAAQFGAGLSAQRGQDLLGLSATRAGNAINFGNAMASSHNSGINNLLSIAGLGLKAFGVGGFGK